MSNLGARVYGLAAIMMGVAGLLWREFAVDWMPVPGTLPGRVALAYVVGALLIAGGILINLRRTQAWGAGVLTAVFAAGLVLLDLTRLASHPMTFDYWDGVSEQLAVTMGGLIALAMARPRATAGTEPIAREVFGLCLLVFGAAHFVYLDFTASLVPKWLPPGPMFWAVATGIAQIAAGLAILSGVMSLLAARLLMAMYAIFGLLVHAPAVWSAPSKHFAWTEFMVNLALAATAWIVAESLAAGRAQTPPLDKVATGSYLRSHDDRQYQGREEPSQRAGAQGRSGRDHHRDAQRQAGLRSGPA